MVFIVTGTAGVMVCLILIVQSVIIVILLARKARVKRFVYYHLL